MESVLRSSRVDPSWKSRFGGIQWRVTEEGIETKTDGVIRTKGEPVTMRRIHQVWGPKIRYTSIITKVPVPVLMMTLATEGALKWEGDHFSYPPLRLEPGYVSDEETPHRISLGPMHVLLSSYRSAMYAPKASREEAVAFSNNLAAGALFIQNREQLHGWDPILIAATYNAGGIYDASKAESRFHSRWCIRAWPGHLDRAAAWYGDACAVLKEVGVDPRPRPPQPIITRGITEAQGR